MAVLNVKRELFELDINHRMETAKNLRMLELAYENMVNSLRTWDKKYLIKSHHDGIVVWGKTWGMSARVNEGDTLCTVISKQQGNPLGHITLSQDEVAEIAVGDKVNIELNKYPTHSYGVLPGRIASVSFVPYNKSYAVEVDFPDGLVTTNRKEIKYEIDMSGRAEIITSSRSILSRIFAPVYELFPPRSNTVFSLQRITNLNKEEYEKEDPDNKQPEYTRYSEDEEQVLDLNELMDVQGGIDDKELSKCGLGCYTGGFVDPTKTQDENTGNE